MTQRADSYGSVAEVTAFTRHLLDGVAAFNSTTRPTVTEVERFVDRASGHLNMALAGRGFTVPIANSTAALSCADWVVSRATEYVELTQRGVGYSEGEGSRVTSFRNLQKSAMEFAKESELGFKYMGAAVAHNRSDGLSFTGMPAQDQRADRDDTGIEQPLFARHQFGDPTTTVFSDDRQYGEDSE